MALQVVTDHVSPLALAGTAFGVYCVGTWIYNLFFHPLRHIPGPWYAAVSNAYMSWKDLQFIKAMAIEELHERYGPVVRIQPNIVAFKDPVAMRTVYNGSSRFPKSAFYKALLTNENDHAMTTLEPGPYAPRKRAYAPHYTPNNLGLYQPEMHEHTRILLDKMDQYNGKRSFDCLILFQRLMVDLIFVSSYGQRLNSLKSWDIDTLQEDGTSEIIASIALFPIRGVLRASFPAFIYEGLLTKIPIKGWQRVVNSDRRIAEYVIDARDKLIARDKLLQLDDTNLNGDEQTDERLSLIHRLLRQQIKAKPEDRLSDLDIISEAMGHTIAGVDTSATALSYMLWNVSKRPEVLKKLRAEIDPLMPDDGHEGKRTVPEYLVLTRLPYLTAYIKESLRVYGSVPSLLERVVPENLQGGFEINGHSIPPGAVVGTQAWSVHRDPKVFPEPYKFNVERWLGETEEMRTALIPFGIGGRMCGGQNLAQYMLRIAFVATIRNFDVVIPPETTEDSMEQRFAFVTLPKGHKVNLTFVPRKSE